MKITDLTPEEYARLFQRPSTIYNSVRFVALNASKVSRVRYLCLADSKPRLGLIVGVDAEGNARAPFSAPFSGFDFNRRPSVAIMLEAIGLLRSEFPGLLLTLPPPIYDPDMISRTQCALLTSGCQMIFTDWDFYIPLDRPVAEYVAGLDAESRKKLRRALRSGFRVEQVNDDPLRAYRVIEINRVQHGYPLRMTFKDVIATTGGDDPIVKAEFFIVTDGETDVAAAMVYEVTSKVVQVIYWGNDVENPACPSPINFLALHLVEHYGAKGFGVLDIGPSSIEGVPSTGLCRFKDSVGCQVSGKATFRL